jgi:Tfp pilus assembly protein PilF
MSTTAENLKRAYQLIRNDQTADAQNILRPILDSEPDKALAWWLLAYAADDPKEVRYARQLLTWTQPTPQKRGDA